MIRDVTERPKKALVAGPEVEEVVHAVAETAVVAKARRERRANCMVVDDVGNSHSVVVFRLRIHSLPCSRG